MCRVLLEPIDRRPLQQRDQRAKSILYLFPGPASFLFSLSVSLSLKNEEKIIRGRGLCPDCTLTSLPVDFGDSKPSRLSSSLLLSSYLGCCYKMIHISCVAQCVMSRLFVLRCSRRYCQNADVFEPATRFRCIIVVSLTFASRLRGCSANNPLDLSVLKAHYYARVTLVLMLQK